MFRRPVSCLNFKVIVVSFFFFQAEDGIRDHCVTGVQTCALPIYLETLLPLGPAVRLVKGAYKEPPDRAFPRKKDVDENFFALSRRLLSEEASAAGVRAAMATHDVQLIRRIIAHAESRGLAKTSYEFQMLYAIQRDEQLRFARGGFRSLVLIAYGEHWF